MGPVDGLGIWGFVFCLFCLFIGFRDLEFVVAEFYCFQYCVGVFVSYLCLGFSRVL